MRVSKGKEKGEGIQNMLSETKADTLLFFRKI
jgi:hypothetical protein